MSHSRTSKLFALTAVTLAAELPRERLLMDSDWRFAPGHATDVSKDFDHAGGEFSYLAKKYMDTVFRLALPLPQNGPVCRKPALRLRKP